MSNYEQSSVEWFGRELDKLFLKYRNSEMSAGQYVVEKFKLERKAKAMHKEETIKLYYAYEDYVLREEGIIKTFGQFYNETFGGNNENTNRQTN